MEIDLARCGRLIDGKKELFGAFYRLLKEYNGKFNLTAVIEEREAYYKHFIDSLAGEPLFPYGATVCEVGSGGGFPSIPLRIVREDLSFTLIESTGKKCAFLKEVAERLGFSNVTVRNIRAEEGGKDPALREKFDVCTARAVARLNTLAEYCMPFVRRGGRFIAYKGSADELGEAENALTLLGGGERTCYRYELPEDMGGRTLICVRKEKNTPAKYPRGQGKERKSPL